MQPDLEPGPVSSRRAPGARERKSEPPRAGIRLQRRLDGRLWLHRDGRECAVEIVHCFPWSQPDRFLSLRDAEGREQAFVSRLGDLDEDSRHALELGLARSGFALEILRVLAIDEDFELRSFSVETKQGPRRFQTALDAWPRHLDGGGLVLEDVYGDLYRISAPQKLDAKSRELMRAFID